jgi:hypothetical protein
MKEQRGQVVAVDADIGLCGDGGLGVQRDAGAGHPSMVRSLAPSPTAIASAGVRPRRAAISIQRVGLGLTAEDRFDDLRR